MPPASAPVRSPPHIVDVLIAERAPRLTRSPAWPLVRPGLYALLGYGKARRMARDFQEQLENEVNLDELNKMTETRSKPAPAPSAPIYPAPPPEFGGEPLQTAAVPDPQAEQWPPSAAASTPHSRSALSDHVVAVHGWPVRTSGSTQPPGKNAPPAH